MSWSLDTWNNSNQTRLDQAKFFLDTGIVGTNFGGNGCTSSSQCASGYKCSGGRCVKITSVGASGGTAGVANNTGGSLIACDGGPDGASTTGSGSSGGCSSPTPIGSTSGGCTTPTCGQGTNSYGEDSDCCGTRCCRYFSTGEGVNINCFCGDCPGTNGQKCGDGYAACGPDLVCINGVCTEAKPCNKFCAEYLESNGENAAGCRQLDFCDECTECTGSAPGGGNYCESKNDRPCHCGGNVGECDICLDDGSLIEGECLECCEIFNFRCKCGVPVDARACRPRGDSGLSLCNVAQNAAREYCLEACQGGDQEFFGCTVSCVGNKTEPAPGACPDPNDPITCPDGFNCVWTGCIESGGNYVLLYDECDMSIVDDDCKRCDCNCDDDCPPCQLCGADGTCYDDPSCSLTPTSVKITTVTRRFRERYACEPGDCAGDIRYTTEDAPLTSSITISWANFEAKTLSPPSPTRPCDDYVRYTSPGGSWYESGLRGIGGPIVINHCPGASYTCPACNGDRESNWEEYQATYEFIS